MLLIPQCREDAIKRKKISGFSTYDEAIYTIYETIGCSDVTRKPNLQYKLSDASKNSAAIGLQSEEDWDGLCEELLAKQKKNKSGMTVSIIVSEQVGLFLSFSTFVLIII